MKEVFRNILFVIKTRALNVWFIRRNLKRIKFLKEKHELSSVHITSFNWFKKSERLILKESKTLNVNWFNFIEGRFIPRSPSRKVVRGVLGKSKNKLINEAKKGAMAYIAQVNKKKNYKNPIFQ